MGGIAWTKEEDLLLVNCIEQYGEGKWHRVLQLSGLKRCRKSCRLRWLNYLRPNIKRGKFSDDEVDLIFKLHRLLGNRWSLIAGRLPGRTANDVKNYWNHHLSKKHITQMEAKPLEFHDQVEVIRPQARTIKTTPLLQKLVALEGPLIDCEPHLQTLQRNSFPAMPFLYQEYVQDQFTMPQNIHNHHLQDHEVQDDKDDDDACFEECGNIYRQLFHDLQFEDDLQVVEDQ